MAPLAAYESQSRHVLEAHRAGGPRAIRVIHENHPRFLDSEIRWLPPRISADDIRGAEFHLDDAMLAVARCHNFRDWEALRAHVAAGLRSTGSSPQ